MEAFSPGDEPSDGEGSGSGPPYGDWVRRVDSTAALLVDGVVLVNQRGEILYANPSFGRLIGRHASEAVGRPLATYLPYSAPSLADAPNDSPRSEHIGERGPRRAVLRRADGSDISVHLACSLFAPGAAAGLSLYTVWDTRDVERLAVVADELFAVVAESPGDATEVVPALMAVIAKRLDFEVATMWRWDAGSESLRCEYAWQEEGASFERFLERSRGAVLRIGDAVPGLVLATGEPVWVPEVSEFPRFQRGAVAAQDGLRSGFAFPVRSHDRTVGVFELFTRARRDPDAPLLSTVATAGARLGEFIERLELEMQRERLLEQLQQIRRRQNFLLSANRALSGARELEDMVARLAAVAVPAIGDLCLIDTVEPDGSIVRVAARHADPTAQRLTDELRQFPPNPDGDHPAAIAIRSGRSFVSDEMPPSFLSDTTRSGRHYELTQLLRFTSYVAVPLTAHGRSIGAITIVSAGSDRRFEEQELTLIEELASQVTGVLERARSYEEQRAVALALQRSLLPARFEPVEGLRVAARYLASNESTEVGGDFYDVISLDPDRVALVIGDVEGHDMGATTVMGKLRSALHAYFEVTHDPAEALDLLDRYVRRHGEGRMATICIATVALGSGETSVVCAGHPAPVLVGAGPPAPIAVRPGLPLGFRAGSHPLHTITLGAGSGLVLYTDGLVERRDGGAEAKLGVLLEVLAGLDLADLEHDADETIASVTEGVATEDDVAVLIALRSGRPRPGPRVRGVGP